MTVQEIFQIKNKYVVQDMDGELILVPLSSQVARMNQMFVLNELGKFIWENILENSSEEQIIEAILKNFEVEKITAQTDLNNFLDKLGKTLS